jgi:hypothetical protein
VKECHQIREVVSLSRDLDPLLGQPAALYRHPTLARDEPEGVSLPSKPSRQPRRIGVTWLSDLAAHVPGTARVHRGGA